MARPFVFCGVPDSAGAADPPGVPPHIAVPCARFELTAAEARCAGRTDFLCTDHGRW